MPKIAMTYVGDDEKVKKALAATNGVQYMEPVDAREVIASGNKDYEVDEEQRALIGAIFDPGKMADVNIPQLQGDNAELMTGLSADKYGRSQVVKAVPDASVPTRHRPMTTTGRPLNRDEVKPPAEAGDESGEEPAKPRKARRK